MNNKILKLANVIEITGKCRSSVYQQISEGTFPKQINLGPKSVGWIHAEIQEWIESRIKARDDQGVE